MDPKIKYGIMGGAVVIITILVGVICHIYKRNKKMEKKLKYEMTGNNINIKISIIYLNINKF
jgi:hypothetical protein